MTHLTENARFDWCGKGVSIILLEHRLKDQPELAELLECFVDAVTKCSKNPECDQCNPVKDESDYIQYLEIASYGKGNWHTCAPGTATLEWYQHEASKCFDMLANDPSQHFAIYTQVRAKCGACGVTYCHRCAASKCDLCNSGRVWHNEDCQGRCRISFE